MKLQKQLLKVVGEMVSADVTDGGFVCNHITSYEIEVNYPHLASVMDKVCTEFQKVFNIPQNNFWYDPDLPDSSQGGSSWPNQPDKVVKNHRLMAVAFLIAAYGEI
jgi:hypothetical protein